MTESTKAPQTRAQRTALATMLAAALAIPAEGLRQYAYNDTGGILTTCRGHTGPDVVKGRKYSLAECDAYLTDDMRMAIAAVDRCVPGLPAEVLAAFGDATYNMGPTIACNRDKSTAARYLASGQLVQACNQLPHWNRGRVMGTLVELPGLTKRRAAEQSLCLTGVTK